LYSLSFDLNFQIISASNLSINLQSDLQLCCLIGIFKSSHYQIFKLVTVCNSKERPYARFFARIYNPVMNGIEKNVLGPRRKALLENLEGKVLEVGAGTGVNFQYYNAKAEVLACEPSASMLQRAQTKLEELGKSNIELLHAGLGDEALAERLPKGGYDYIVCTLVLCTVPDLDAALKELHSWLKPTGQLIVLEHIRAQGAFGKALQWTFGPLWCHLAEGCHLSRQTDEKLEEYGFEAMEEEYFSKGVPFYQAKLKLAE
jgi:ubiquinone/menaquinone biosynthesis C-methylase UbiE